MQAMTLLVLVAAILLALVFEQVLLAEILFLALIAIIIYVLLYKTAVGAKKVGESLSKNVMTDLEKAKGQTPKSTTEIGKMLEVTGAKVGETTWTRDRDTWRSPDLIGRIGAGSKNLLDSIARLLK